MIVNFLSEKGNNVSIYYALPFNYYPDVEYYMRIVVLCALYTPIVSIFNYHALINC